MPTESERLLSRLSKKATDIADEIDSRQSALDSRLSVLEKELFDLLQTELFGALEFEGGKLKSSSKNLLLLTRIDNVFEQWQRQFGVGLLREFVVGLLDVANMTGEMYAGMGAEQLLRNIATDTAVLHSAIGVDAAGNIIRGSVLYDISQAFQVRQDIKNVVLQAVRQGQTLRVFSQALRKFVVSTPGTSGRLKTHWRTYAYDIFNQAAEVKNEQFRRGLDLQWFIYVGDVIKDSRPFCAKKAGKVFAVVEADREWPNDPDLIGKGSGVPYVPRIDRGRWNCRHRIRYISEEMAVILDKEKVRRIKGEYGSQSI